MFFVLEEEATEYGTNLVLGINYMIKKIRLNEAVHFNRRFKMHVQSTTSMQHDFFSQDPDHEIEFLLSD